MDGYLLEMKNICKVFPGVVALNQVSFSLRAGEVHVLLGENGAGKSTLIKILAGAYTKTAGEILIHGQSVSIEQPTDASKYGISVIYQEFNLNPYMPIYENIFLGKEPLTKLGLINKRQAIEKSRVLCQSVGLDVSPLTRVKDLSVAQKQLVEIAKALSMDVKILVLDEPTATLTDKEIERLFELIGQLKRQGVGIIYISHRMAELKQIGDRCTVLRDGCCIGTVELAQVSEDDLIRMMVGREVTFERKKNGSLGDEIVLEVKNLCYDRILKDISFELRKGEILGIAGLVGSGRTELAKCIVGEYRANQGQVLVEGRLLKNSSPATAIEQGVVYLSEDRKAEGLILKHDVKTNVTLPALRKILAGPFLDKTREKSLVSELVEQLKIKTGNLETLAGNLSGGNQQKVVVAKWLLTGAKVYIFDEPTRGIDVGAREEIYKIMEMLIESGASIIMISSDLVEILKMSDRVLVMHDGEVTGILENTEELTQEKILSYAIGGRN